MLAIPLAFCVLSCIGREGGGGFLVVGNTGGISYSSVDS